MSALCRLVLTLALLASIQGAARADGKTTYDRICAGCHATGVLGAPRPGNAADWTQRLPGGTANLYRSALQGTAKGMPPKAGRPDLPDDQIRAAVDYMIAGLPRPSAKPAAPKKPASTQVEAAQPAQARPAAQAPIASAEANAFNRLLRPPSQRNLPPTQDGIHDATLDGTQALQPPRAAFTGLPGAGAGNRVDWVRALEQKKIAPRWQRSDQSAEPVVLDLNIVREVKGSMPDVVYPHKQHTEWLDCSNCHPALFVPQKGANQISMAGILLGQACGACHGKVAFPVSECRLCHSKKKGAAGQAAAQRKP
jgi:c(7)-type cytochrome triheme protein